ncbi:hypothetical protein HC024_16200 [Methylococcaceae bacterium WWC4]|nr:hypothetical protein [Methylococcaceae bacterium WWC4]
MLYPLVLSFFNEGFEPDAKLSGAALAEFAGWFSSFSSRNSNSLYLSQNIVRLSYELAYACQRETKDDRFARRADKIRDKLGWHRGILNPNGTKPKGMHWKTYWRLRAEHDGCVNVALLGIAKRFGFLEKMLG